MRLRNVGAVLLAIVLTGISVRLADAQERYGGLAGVVMDSTRAPIPGATVTVTNKQTGASRVVVTSGDGSYRIPDLEPGRYSVTAELSGFQKAEADDLIVLLGRTFEFSPQLQVG